MQEQSLRGEKMAQAVRLHYKKIKLDKNIVNSHVATLELNYLRHKKISCQRIDTKTALTGMTTEGYFWSDTHASICEEQQKK